MALKNDITPPLLQDEQMSSLPPKHNMRPQNLIPSSLLIFGLLGGYDCGGGVACGHKRATVFRMSSASHIRLGPLPNIYLCFFHYFSEKRRHTRTRIPKKGRAFQFVKISTYLPLTQVSGPNGNGAGDRKRAPLSQKKEKAKQ